MTYFFYIREKKLIESALGSEIIESIENNGNFYIKIKQASLIRVSSILFSNAGLRFCSLINCFAVDFLKEFSVFSIYYQLLSFQLKKTLFLVTDVKEYESLQSLTILFKNVDWYEREIFDMFGMIFNDHPDMRRLLNDYDYANFPLRKNCS